MKPRQSRWVWALLLLPVGLSLIALTLGRYRIAPGDVFGSLFGVAGVPDTIRALILRVRLPRILAAVCIGANLAVSGVAFQGLFRNPLVAPRILGVSSGAAFGAALAFLISNNPLFVQPLAFAFGILAIFLVWMVGRQFGASLLVLVVTGVLVGAFFNALLGLIKYVADPLDALPAITYWLLGGLSGTRWVDLWPLLAITGAGLSFFLVTRWRLNLLTLNETEAISLGLNVKQFRLGVILTGTLLVAASVATSGIIGWVGLIVPHAARALVGPDHARLVPTSIALGAVVLIILDTLSRTALPTEIPLGILSGLIGVPVFLLLFMRAMRNRQGGWR